MAPSCPSIERALSSKWVVRAKPFPVSSKCCPLQPVHQDPIVKMTKGITATADLADAVADKALAVVSKQFRKVGPGCKVKLVGMFRNSVASIDAYAAKVKKHERHGPIDNPRCLRLFKPSFMKVPISDIAPRML